MSNQWKQFRFLEFGLGLNEAVKTFIPVLLVFTLLGNEEALGTVQSFSAILASLMVFFGIKSLHIKHRLRLMTIGIAITIIGGVLFGLLYSGIGVVLFFAAQALAWPVIWVALNSINYDLIDQDNKKSQYHYAYVCDQEIYLNGGRVVGILLFMAGAWLFSNDIALRFAPLFFALTQLVLFFTTRTIEKKSQHS